MDDLKGILFFLVILAGVGAVSVLLAEVETWLGFGPEWFGRHGMKMGMKFKGWVVWEAPPFPDLSDKQSFEERAKRYVFIARDGPLAGAKLELAKIWLKRPIAEADGSYEAVTVISVGDEGFCAFPSSAIPEPAWGDYFGRPLGEMDYWPKYNGYWQRASMAAFNSHKQ